LEFESDRDLIDSGLQIQCAQTVLFHREPHHGDRGVRSAIAWTCTSLLFFHRRIMNGAAIMPRFIVWEPRYWQAGVDFDSVDHVFWWCRYFGADQLINSRPVCHSWATWEGVLVPESWTGSGEQFASRERFCEKPQDPQRDGDTRGSPPDGLPA
jgi:hypothetical protein